MKKRFIVTAIIDTDASKKPIEIFERDVLEALRDLDSSRVSVKFTMIQDVTQILKK